MTIRVALIQMTSGRDVGENLRRSTELGLEAAAAGAQWLVFPENAPFLGADRERDEVAEPIDGAIMRAYQSLARDASTWVTIGGFPELYDGEDDGGHNYNTQVLVSPDGERVATYRKLHLFDAQVDSETTYCESDYVRAGDAIT